MSKTVHFTQFMFPDGRPRSVEIEMPDENVGVLAEELNAAGWSFEVECFPATQMVHADCCDDEGPLAQSLCDNGPDAPGAIEGLIRSAHNRWVEAGRPKAVGDRLGAIARQIEQDAWDAY